MPELPEVTVYVEAFRREIVGEVLHGIRVRSPSLVRTFDPRLSEAHGRRVLDVARLGKRLVWSLEDDLHLVIHLMVTGRFHRKPPGTRIPRKYTHASFDFAEASFFLTEMGKEKKARLHLVRGDAGVAALDPGGLEVLKADADAFAEALTRENRTLKRALTDPRILSGIGNAHSDEILHAAGLSPAQLTRNLDAVELERLRHAVVDDLSRWTELLRAEVGEGFPEKITAFHPEMRVHGRFGEACPVCGDPVQRIVYASRETNYCATCQTGGRLLADRAFSRLLGEDWPRSIEELETHIEARRARGDRR